VKQNNTLDILVGTYSTAVEANTRVDFNISDGATGNPDVNVMTFTGNNVGIGVTAPLDRLHVNAITFGANQNRGIRISSTNGEWVGRFALVSDASGVVRLGLFAPINAVGGTNESLTLFSNGFVGVGITAPTDRLHVSGALRVTGAIKDSTNSAGASGQGLSSSVTGTSWGWFVSALGTTGTDINLSNNILNIPTASALNRGALSSADWNTFNGKQALLVSGTNIKTINGITLLGSGDITIVGNATHTGDVTGSTTLTIANNSITTSKIADYNVSLVKLPQMDIPNVFVGKYPGAVGSPQYLNASDLKNILNINFIDKEIPTGLINGTNVTFTLANTPI